MSHYFWREYEGPPAGWYPNWVEGVGLWRDFIRGDVRARRRLLDALVAARATVRWGEPGTELAIPRLFVSHRKDDETESRRIATIAQAEGFQVWLDVLDDELQRTAQASAGMPADALQIALIIEMALLNCTHVIALITPRTPGTYWVPYEYGRVKDSSPHSLRAACWIDQHVTYEPEYLELGIKTRSDHDIRNWLRGELAQWRRQFPVSIARSGVPVGATSTPHLSADELDAIAQPFRDGPGIGTSAPERAIFSARSTNPLTPDAGPMPLTTGQDIIVKGLRLKKPDSD